MNPPDFKCDDPSCITCNGPLRDVFSALFGAASSSDAASEPAATAATGAPGRVELTECTAPLPYDARIRVSALLVTAELYPSADMIDQQIAAEWILDTKSDA